MQPLASTDQLRPPSPTNLSTSISLSILDRDGNELSMPTTLHHPYRFLIPRDPSLTLSPMTLQNVTSINSTPHHLLFNLHYVSLIRSDQLSVSLRLEMKSFNTSLAYLLIYRFDSSPQLNSSTSQIDGWSLFCPSTDDVYTYFLDNQQTVDHQSVIFGLRELNSTELNHFCSNRSANATLPRSDSPFHFTSNYELRLYTSGCYYLDQNNQWRSDGLVVSFFSSILFRLSFV